MALLKLLAAPVRRLLRFPLFQFIAVVAIVFLLQAADEHSLFGWIFDQLDHLVAATVLLCSNLFSVKSFTRSGLTLFLTVAYVYLALAVILFLLRIFIRGMIDLVGWSNAFGLRNAIARERGIAAYRAWLPLERIRPASIPQSQWEETFSVLALSCPARCCELPSLVRNRGGAATILHTVSRRFVAYGSDKDGVYPCRG